MSVVNSDRFKESGLCEKPGFEPLSNRSAATNWEQVTLSQDEIDAGWQLLTVDEQSYLCQLFNQYRQSPRTAATKH